MTYVDGFLIPVPEGKKEAYRDMAAKAAPIFQEHGAKRVVECWGDDVPDGTVTDFKRAVKAEEGENVVFSWIEYPSKEARDAANEKVMADPRMHMEPADMPFDGKRMIMAGFEPIVGDKAGGASGYIDGFVAAVPAANKQAYRDQSAAAAAVFKEYGASNVVETWGDDVPDGKVTDFKGAVQAKDNEKVVFSWIEWPSKQARDEAWPKIMADERMQPGKQEKTFDGKRMIYGGFAPILDQ